MAVSAGTRFGPYEIIALVGAGGMGEVYRARDIRLHRDVAIKVLPQTSQLTDAAEARLAREARAIASLNHSNICTIYDVGQTEGRPFLVMELLEGESLYERLRAGPFPAAAVLEHGIALADALDAAHARGLIHRDLKPANIFLTKRGQTKVLDFGLAKDVASFETVTFEVGGHVTDPAVTIGTLAYMSPEQLRGEPLDSRTDIFSLGLVLYEMATGRHAFSAPTGPLIWAAILRAEPAAPSAVRTNLRARLDDIILKALEKDRELRYQSAAELRTDLKRVQRGSADRAKDPSGASDPPPPPSPAAILAPPSSSDVQLIAGVARRHRAGIALASLVLLAVATGAGILSWRTLRAPRAGSDSFPNLYIQPLTLTGDVLSGAISPDGKFVAYVRAQGGIALRQISADSDVQLVPFVPGRALWGLTFTEDGNFVDYLAGDGPTPDLWRVPLLGGTPRRLVSGLVSAPGRSPDGRRIAFLRALPGENGGSALVIADEDGSHESVLVTRRPPLDFLNISSASWAINRPAWSFDGKQIVVVGTSVEAKGAPSEVVAFDTASGAAVRRIPVPGAFVWEAAFVGPTRLLASVSMGSLLPGMWSLDLRDTTWSPVAREFSSFSFFSLTSDRHLVLATRSTRRNGLWLGDQFGSTGEMVVPESAVAPQAPVVDSLGGIVYFAIGGDGRQKTYRLPPGGKTPIRLADASGINGYAVAPDGTFVIIPVGLDESELRRMNSDGTGSVKLFDHPVGGPAITPDGRTVLFSNVGMPGLYSMPVSGGSARKISDVYVSRGPSISPDGRQIAFTIPEPGKTVICDLPDCPNMKTLALKGFQWAPDGKGIAFLNEQDHGNLWEQTLDGRDVHALTHFSDPRILEFAWSADGKRLVLARGTTSSDIVLLKGLQ
jgi:serine/threonine protein kinase/Tol biopolymer transport system component